MAVMLDGMGILALDVLIKSATEGDIDDLQAAANAKYRLSLLQAGFQKGRFHFIAFIQDFFRFRDRLLAVESRVDVISSAEKDAIQS